MKYVIIWSLKNDKHIENYDSKKAAMKRVYEIQYYLWENGYKREKVKIYKNIDIEYKDVNEIMEE